MTYSASREKWGIEFESNSLKYKGTATRMWAYDNVFFLVNYYWERTPEEVYSGDFYPKKKLVDTLIIIEWECHTKGIESNLVGLIGSAIEERLKESKFSIF